MGGDATGQFPELCIRVGAAVDPQAGAFGESLERFVGDLAKVGRRCQRDHFFLRSTSTTICLIVSKLSTVNSSAENSRSNSFSMKLTSPNVPNESIKPLVRSRVVSSKSMDNFPWM